MENKKPIVCLSIAGLDPSGGAGIIADVKTFSAFGCFATAAVTSVTFQNTQGVYGAEHMSGAAVRGQIEPILDDFTVGALKTGMLPTTEIIEETASIIHQNDLYGLVVDPVVRSTSGFDLISDQALDALIKSLFPLSDLVTPNIPEAERISKLKIESIEDLENAARIMQEKGAENVLIKGGHDWRNKTDSKKATDYLFTGSGFRTFESDMIDTTATHGTGCTLSAGIAARLALGDSLVDAVQSSKRFVTNAIRTAPNIGKGHSPINQLYENSDN